MPFPICKGFDKYIYSYLRPMNSLKIKYRAASTRNLLTVHYRNAVNFAI